MTTQYVKYCSHTRFSCAGSTAPDVILCLQEGLAVDPTYPFIAASICQFYTLGDPCGNPVWQYTFSYDSAGLADPSTPLGAADILGLFCLDCLTDWIQALTSGNVPANDAWNILGNTGTTDGTNFAGTVDNVAYDVRVHNFRARRTEPQINDPGDIGPVNAPNIIDGNEDNSIDGIGSTIGGGGYFGDTGRPNSVTQGFYSTISGGGGNRIVPEALPDNTGDIDYGGYSAIGGGADNRISWNGEPSADGAGFHVIGGGQSNTIENSGGNTVIGGGEINEIVYDLNMLDPSAGSGANSHSITADTIAGGNVNSILGIAPSAPGLYVNALGDNAIGGGQINEIDNGLMSTVAGGYKNLIFISEGSAPFAGSYGPVSYNGIASGARSLLSDTQASFVGGGIINQILGAECSGVLSGFKNLIKSTAAASPQVDVNGRYNILNPSTTTGSGNSITGGTGNTIDDGFNSTILGGAFLEIGAASVGYQSPTTRNFAGIPAGGYAAYTNNPSSIAQVDVSAFPDIAYWGDVDTWVANTDGTARKVKFIEPNTDTDFSSANYSSFEAQAQAANIQYIWPAAAGTAGQALKILSVVGTVVTLHWA